MAVLRQFRAWNIWRQRLGTTDGCSYVPDFDFVGCCIAHDLHYEKHDMSREQADDELYYCIYNKDHPYLAWWYWAGARLWGQSSWDNYGKLG